MTKHRYATKRSDKSVILAGLVAFLVSCGAHEIRAQDAGADAPARTASEPTAAKKPKLKPRVKRAEKSIAGAIDDSAPDHQPAGAKHICVIDRGAVDQQSVVNVASNKRLQELRANAQAQVDSARQKIENQLQGNNLELTKHPDDMNLKQEQQELAEKMRDVVDRAGLFSREYEATRQGVTSQLQSLTRPIVQGVASSNSCSLVLARDSIVDPGESLDISRFVIEKMNAQLQFKPFYLVDLDKK